MQGKLNVVTAGAMLFIAESILTDKPGKHYDYCGLSLSLSLSLYIYIYIYMITGIKTSLT
jgi:hypothetical protein